MATGRYDPIYEDNGVDYPVGFVRWTEQRNLRRRPSNLKTEKLDVKDLISKRFDINEAKSAYQLLNSKESTIGILFQYKNFSRKDDKSIKFKDLIENKSALEISVIGSGNYAKRVILPILSKKDINLQTIFSRSGLESTLWQKNIILKNLVLT